LHTPATAELVLVQLLDSIHLQFCRREYSIRVKGGRYGKRPNDAATVQPHSRTLVRQGFQPRSVAMNAHPMSLTGIAANLPPPRPAALSSCRRVATELPSGRNPGLDAGGAKLEPSGKATTS
jgi:hypothetical protein